MQEPDASGAGQNVPAHVQDAVAAALAREHGQGTDDGAAEQMVGRTAASSELPGAAAVLSDGDDDANDDFVDSDKKPATAGVVHERKVPILQYFNDNCNYKLVRYTDGARSPIIGRSHYALAPI